LPSLWEQVTLHTGCTQNSVNQSDEKAPVIGPGDAAFRMHTISINNQIENSQFVEAEIT